VVQDAANEAKPLQCKAAVVIRSRHDKETGTTEADQLQKYGRRSETQAESSCSLASLAVASTCRQTPGSSIKSSQKPSDLNPLAKLLRGNAPIARDVRDGLADLV
jgi:hypothetical protein